MKNQKDNIIRRWYRLAEPNKRIWFWQIFYFVVYAVLLTVFTIFAAKTINCMYAKDWKGAFFFLFLELMTIVIRNISLHLQYKYYAKNYGWVRENVTRKIYEKLMNCDNAGIKKMSKEKIINIALNNLSYIGEFPDSVASFIAYSFQVVITLITVFVANWLAGVIILLLGVVNCFAYSWFNKKLGQIMMVRYEKKDDLFKSYNKVIDGKMLIKEFGGEKEYQHLVEQDVKNYSKAFQDYCNVHSSKANLWYALWNVVVYAVAALMLYYVSRGTMEMTVYLIIVPYLSTCTDKLNTLFDKTSALENMRVDVDRIETILSLSDSQLSTYGEMNSATNGYNLGLIDVSCNEKSSESNFLEHADISFKMEDINIVRGDRGSGKRLVFNMLRRSIKPKTGKVLLDNLDLYDYSEKTFKNHINYCASHPSFISGTIKENLMLVSKRFDAVRKACEKVGVLQTIEALPDGFNCQIIDVTSSETLFLIGLARALLTNPCILMIYELPQDVSEEFIYSFRKIIKKLENQTTVIFFTHSTAFDDIAGLVYVVENGEVKVVQNGQSVEEEKPVAKAKKVASKKKKVETKK